MNLFNFDINDVIKSFMLAYSYGLFFGFLMGLIRYLFLSAFERSERG